jgi:hypothetical protein
MLENSSVYLTDYSQRYIIPWWLGVRNCFLPVGRACFSSRLKLISVSPLFLSLIFLGTASGQFLRPAASRLLLSRFLPNSVGPSHKAAARLGSRGLSLLSAPGKWGKKKEKIYVLPMC